MLKRILLTIIITIIGCCQTVLAQDYPAQCRVTAQTLNIRSGPGKSYYKLGQFHQGDIIVVKSVTQNGSMPWGCIDFTTVQEGYVAMRYLDYIGAIQETHTESAQTKQSSGFFDWFDSIFDGLGSFLSGLWTLIKWGFIILLVLLVIGAWEYIVQLAIYAGIFAGIGALIFYIFGGSGETGAAVGLVVAVLIGLRLLIASLEINYSEIGGIISFFLILGYKLVSLPVYFLNRLEHFLVSPWRYFFMRNWVSDDIKPALRFITECITIIMYIATTPLRLVNAIIYNIFIHCITGIYDLLLEVLAPSDDDEGGDDVWKWIYMLPYRIIYYAIWHVLLLVVESAIWTVVDVFIPARTFYHGTTLKAANMIMCDPQRNDFLKRTSGWTSGNFTSSTTPNRTWAGRGVYFAIRRSLAMAYSGDDRSGLGGDPVMIVCRVSIGRVISYALMPNRVYNQTGNGGWHDEINKFADAHGYTTGEWFNGYVWEYCLFDWQNGYNDLWRIRPIYILNLRTGLAQHIRGGMQHWLFYKGVMDNLFG